MLIRETMPQDLLGLLTLYTQLHDNVLPAVDDALNELWLGIVRDPNHHIIVAVDEGRIISSCVLIVVPNLTQGQRPYALIENVITQKEYRNSGHGRKVLDYARQLAMQNNCYKIMLMTGSKEDHTLHFYKGAGYGKHDKTAFVQWLY